MLCRLSTLARSLPSLGAPPACATPVGPSEFKGIRLYRTATSFNTDEEQLGGSQSFPWLLAALGATGVLIGAALNLEKERSRGVPFFATTRPTAFAAEALHSIEQHDEDFAAFSQHESFVPRLDDWLVEINALLASEEENKQVYGSLLARKARLLYKKALETPGIGPVDKQVFIYAAFRCVEQALELNDQDWFVHKWFAIVITSIGDYEGNKKKLENAYLIKDHLLRSLELNPTDPTTYHALGTWYFTFADMGWVMRNLAAAIFATPPKGTYEEALECFLRAEEISPGFYLKNNLYIVKTYLGLGNKERAMHWKALGEQMPVTNEDDRAAFAELKKLSV